MGLLSDRLLAQVGAERVFADCGIDITLLRGAREGSIPCPFHQERNGESLSLDIDRGLFHCFGRCGDGGDLVTLFGKAKGIPPGPDLYRSVEQAYLGNGHSPANLPAVQKPALPRLHPGLDAVVTRAFAAGTVIPGIPELYEVRSYSWAQGSGLIFLIRDPVTGLACDLKRRQLKPAPDPRFKSVSMTPYCLKCQKRAPRSSDCMKDHPAEVARARAGLFGYRAVRERRGRILLCAGEKDGLSGAQAFLGYGIVPCSWSAGEGSDPEGIKAVAEGREVLVLYDADDAGSKAGPARTAYLQSQGLRSANVSWSLLGGPPAGGKDLYDWLRTRPDLKGAAAALLALPCGDGTVPDGLTEPPTPSPRQELPAPLPGPIVKTEAPEDAAYELDKKDQGDIASQFLLRNYMDGTDFTLRHYQGSFWHWEGTKYEPVERVIVRQEVEGFIRGGGIPPTKGVQEGAIYFMEGQTAIPGDQDPPFWIGAPPDGLVSRDLIPFANGILEPVADEVYPHRPGFFNTYALPFPYEPHAPPPKRWIAFLAEVFPASPESIALVQEMFGYLLTPDHRYQKFFALIGVTNGGKSLITEVLQHIVGMHNCASVSLTGLLGTFGLQDLIGKSIAFSEEASIDKATAGPVTDMMKKLTAGNTVTVKRKNLTSVTVKLPTRFVTVSNSIPDWLDYSGALQRRVIPIRFTVDFSNRADPTLKDRLTAEATGIINWALEGRTRLHRTGRFTLGRQSLDLWDEIDKKANRLREFIAQYLDLAESEEVAEATLYTLYQGWAHRNGHGKASHQTFIANLRSAIPILAPCSTHNGRPALRGLRVKEGMMREVYGDRRDELGDLYSA